MEFPVLENDEFPEFYKEISSVRTKKKKILPYFGGNLLVLLFFFAEI
jgi:hypothetical protein